VDIFEKIENKSVTKDDFNLLIAESLPDVVGFNSDRIRRRVNPQRGIGASPEGISPKSSITPKRSSEGINVSPNSTAEGQRSLKAAGRREKRKALRAEEFVTKHRGHRMLEYMGDLAMIDKGELLSHVDKLLGEAKSGPTTIAELESGVHWLAKLRTVIDGR